MTKTIPFDPGYGQHLNSFIINVENMYTEINKFKNLGQKKFKFKVFHPQITALLEKNTAFYLGCLLWATYVVSNKGLELIGNHCYGNEYNEEFELQEINYMAEFVKFYGKDTKYYLNTNFEYSTESQQILDIYKEFAKMNEGFVKSKNSDDIKMPKSLKTPDEKGIAKIFETITKEVIPTGDFSKLYKLKSLIM